MADDRPGGRPAFFFGHALTVRGVLRAGLGLRRAVRVALVADTVSIAVMEIVDNGVMLTVPGAMEAGLTSRVFRASLAGALAVAFVVTLPVNHRLTAAGRRRWSTSAPARLTRPGRAATPVSEETGIASSSGAAPSGAAARVGQRV